MSQKCFSNEVNSSAAVAPRLQCVEAVAMLLGHGLSAQLHGLSMTPKRLLIIFFLKENLRTRMTILLSFRSLAMSYKPQAQLKN